MRQGCQVRGWVRLACTGALAAGLTNVSGCLTFINPVEPPPPTAMQLSHSIAPAARDHVNIFFINGLDPGCLGNLSGLRDYVHALGFQQTYYGQAYHGSWFAQEIRRIRAADTDARIALVGFSLGTNVGRGLADSLEHEGIGIDLLVCLSSNNVIDFSHDRPANVSRYIDILVHGRDLGPSDDPQTERHNLSGLVWHFGAPSHPKTLEIMAHELTTLAGTVPLADPPAPPPPFQPEALPVPRPEAPTTGGEPREGWELLTPVSRLREPPHLDLPPVPQPKPNTATNAAPRRAAQPAPQRAGTAPATMPSVERGPILSPGTGPTP